MPGKSTSRRGFLKLTGAVAGAGLACTPAANGAVATLAQESAVPSSPPAEATPPDYTLHIVASPIEIAPKHIISAVTYNGQFPGPLLRFKEGRPVTVEIHNDTDTPEQLHWHGQLVPADVDGAAEEGTPYVPAHGMRRITFTPRPAGFRFYHTHNRAGRRSLRRAVQRPGRPRVHRARP